MKYVGLWLDHKNAVVSTWVQNKETTKKIHSKLSPQYKAKHASRIAPKKQEQRREHVIAQFYDEVFKTVRSPDKVLLMGPGIAKKEFKTFLEQKGFSGKIVKVTSADKMTDRQVAAQTRNFFKLGIS